MIVKDQLGPSLSKQPALAILLGSLIAVAGLAASAHGRPLGDGKISTSPGVGYLMSCQTQFNANAPGAFNTGPWISGSTYDADAKPTVDGSIGWPSEIMVTRQGDKRMVRANNLPGHGTGVFPIAGSDDAYQYDRNPNSIQSQDIALTLPADPQSGTTASCVPMGMIGFALSGTAIYNAVDARGKDAPAYEIQDGCGGHPQRQGQYHYHDRSPCLIDSQSQPNGHSDLVGYALDGFGVFGIHGDGGQELTTADLDDCHGHNHAVDWDGERKTIFHYHMTDEYPYTIGCYRGTPIETGALRNPPGQRRPPPRRRN